MPTTIVTSVVLFNTQNGSDKEYHATLEDTGNGYVVNYRNGKRGNANATGTKTSYPVDLNQAQKIYDQLVRKKMSDGYKSNGTVSSGVTTVNTQEQTENYPQLLNAIDEDRLEELINDDDYMAQEKLDGKRIMAESELKGVTTSNRKGLKCGVPSEIEKGISVFRGTLLDGEMIGNIYHVFDLLRLGGVKWDNQSCLMRFTMLEQMMQKLKPQNMAIVRSANTTAEKRALVESLRHKEGVVFKLKSAPYTPGRPNKGGSQLKCKFWSDVSVQVLRVNAKRSVAVGIMDNGKLVDVGNVTVPPNYDLPNVGDIVDVIYLYAYKGGCLYQPKYKGIRDDHDCDDITKLKYKSEDSDDD